MKRYLVAAGVGTLVFGGVLGSASALDINEAAVAQYGQTTDLTCDENVTIASYSVETTPAPSMSHGVRITDINNACENHDLFATASNGADAVIATGSAQITGNAVSVTWEGGPVDVSQIEKVGLTIE